MAEQKSFDPSRRKLERAQREGNFPRSAVFTAGMVLLLPSIGLLLFERWGTREVADLFRLAAADGFSHPELVAKRALVVLVGIVLTVLTTTALFGVVLNVAHLGFHLDPAQLAPKLERVDLISGLRRIVMGLAGISWILIRAAVVLGIGGFMLVEGIRWATGAFDLTPDSLGLLATAGAVRTLSILGCIAATVGVVDLIRSRRKYRRELSMSHDEMRREHREEEGDPMVKAMRRSLHQSLAQKEIEQRVRRSKVIVVERALG